MSRIPHNKKPSGIELQRQKKTLCNAHERGALAENLVRDHFLALGFRIRFHQKKIFGVEYDWVFANDEEVIYVEVKSVKSAPFFLHRWPRRQKQRFIRVAAILAEQAKSRFFLALVDYKSQIHLFQVGSEIDVG